jgi:hypothetical protein
MKQDFNDIKKEILKKNLMIKAIYGGDNSNKTQNMKKRLEVELDSLLYRYFKYRNHLSSKNDSYHYFDE